MRKATLLVGLAAGYVLGTRDGRMRYEQMKAKAISMWQDPRVQEKAPQVQEKVSEVAQKVTSQAKKKGGSRKSDSSGVSAPPPRTTGPVNPAPTSSTSPSSLREPVDVPEARDGDGR